MPVRRGQLPCAGPRLALSCLLLHRRQAPEGDCCRCRCDRGAACLCLPMMRSALDAASGASRCAVGCAVGLLGDAHRKGPGDPAGLLARVLVIAWRDARLAVRCLCLINQVWRMIMATGWRPRRRRT